MQMVWKEILDLLGESSCGDVGAARHWRQEQYQHWYWLLRRDQCLANESRSQQGTWRYLTSQQGTWKYLTSKALEEAELINWSASLRGLREHLKSRQLLMI